ncbi:hypothetical protein JQ619_24510 [Bradyrhizobium denitrificans]|jgi:hypothetical protein|uniref:Uncharacterized protein n=2 Tax=Nitrobacteraceae TaxID=41294 RepID=A0ABS5GC65_9BRAD|nr:hypothetical protein [Bradyrhizobium denitrificans]NPU27281.1 hypothetical protein [Bradyrhizobium sp. LMG 8443]
MGNVSSGRAMNSTTSLRVKELNARNELSADQTAPAEQLEPDFALVQLDTTFVTLLLEISALESQHGDDREPRDAENVRSDGAGRTQKIESVLARLAPIERAIMATPARTIVGLGIKARHASYVVSEHWDVPIEQMEWDARAVRLLIEAICKVAGVRLPFSNDADGALL